MEVLNAGVAMPICVTNAQCTARPEAGRHNPIPPFFPYKLYYNASASIHSVHSSPGALSQSHVSPLDCVAAFADVGPSPFQALL